MGKVHDGLNHVSVGRDLGSWLSIKSEAESFVDIEADVISAWVGN